MLLGRKDKGIKEWPCGPQHLRDAHRGATHWQLPEAHSHSHLAAIIPSKTHGQLRQPPCATHLALPLPSATPILATRACTPPSLVRYTQRVVGQDTATWPRLASRSPALMRPSPSGVWVKGWGVVEVVGEWGCGCGIQWHVGGLWRRGGVAAACTGQTAIQSSGS
jgi:hypothetical protein